MHNYDDGGVGNTDSDDHNADNMDDCMMKYYPQKVSGLTLL